MKILLVEPAKGPVSIGAEDWFLFEPLALEYVAAGVADRHEVRILDERLNRSLHKTLDEFRPDVVGVTAYTVQLESARRVLESARRRDPNVRTVVGGHHATVQPRDFMNSHVDAIVGGEGVTAFRTLIERFEKNESLAGIPGVSFRNGDSWETTAPGPVEDLDSLPRPARHLTRANRTAYHCEYMKPLASMRTSKGCPFHCTFCSLWKIAGGKYFKRSPESILEEIRTIEEEWVFFADDESLVDAKRMTRLAELIEASGLKKKFFLYGRADTIVAHPDLLAAWRRVGLQRVFVGLEFFRDEDLAFVGKGSSTDDNEKAVKILQGLGIDVYASFIVRQEFTARDFADLARYCQKLGLEFATFSVLTPLPGTDYFESVKDKILTQNPQFFDFFHTVLPTTLSLEEFYREYRRLYRTAIPIGKGMRFIARFRWNDVVPALASMGRMFRRMETIPRDYEGLAGG